MDENGEQIVTDFSVVCGRSFLGFASFMHGPISFEELTSKLESADGTSVDAIMSDLVDSESDSDYGLLKSNKRVLPFAKLINTEG